MLYRELSPDFFSLNIVDEYHRGSAAEDSGWQEILEHFKSATHLTAAPIASVIGRMAATAVTAAAGVVVVVVAIDID